MSTTVQVLLVEDDEDDYLITRSLLGRVRDRSYALRWVQDVESALREVEASRPDVILSDIRLGGRTGMDLISELREGTSPVILLTGKGTRALDLEAEAAGAADYLIKGEITPELLERSIRYAMRQYALLAEIRSLAITDELTGLHNRRGFVAVAAQQLCLADRQNYSCVMFYADLDSMKQINDIHGHAAGDEALREVARTLLQTFRASDVVGRMGGDEFAVLSIQADDRSAPGILGRLDANLKDRAGEAGLPLECSVGYVLYSPGTGDTLEALLARADAAMYETKRRRKSAVSNEIDGRLQGYHERDQPEAHSDPGGRR